MILESIKALALREIELCATQEDILRVGKFWKWYFAQYNKFLAGKRPEPPYPEEYKA